MKTYNISCPGHKLELGKRTCVMGILNITPDSFSDGGIFFKSDDAVGHGGKMARDGADIIDIGGESTRPFSEKISAEEELRRVLPVIEKLAPRISIPISIDTTKAFVAKKAIEAGASVINDISALRFDPDMAGLAAEYKVPVILMHMKGTPGDMQISPEYDDLMGEVRDFFENAVENAEKNGILRSKIIIDPGIGFGKTVEHNLVLINRLRELQTLDLPILTGTSRKAFIRKILSQPSEPDPLSSVAETGTQASVAASVFNGAHIVRVHDVANTCATLKIIDAVRSERGDL